MAIYIILFLKAGIMMYQRIVMTSGISLLNNYRLVIKEGFPDFFTEDEALCKDKKMLSGEVYNYIKKYLSKTDKLDVDASAEVSMVNILQRQDCLVESPIITLFYTDTFKGRTSALLNQWLLENYLGAHVKLKEIYDVDVNDRVVLNRALGIYLSDVGESLQEGEPNSTCFAPIGGYKVLTSLGYLVGALHGYPTAYLHERSTILHKIPAVHIDIDESFIEEHHKIFKKFFRGDYFVFNELNEVERALVKKQPTFFEHEEGLVALNPFGRFLCNQNKFYSYFKPHVKMAHSIKEMIDQRFSGYWTDVYAEINRLINQHSSANDKYRGTLYHERSFNDLNEEELTYHLFKGHNQPVFRAVWKYNQSKDCYYIAHIWFNHEKYERQLVAVIKNAKNQRNWIDLTHDLYAS